MFWVCVAFIGSIAYILLAIIPHSLISILSGSGKLAHLDARYWARWTLACANVKIEVDGLENLPQGPAIYMANHSSHFDVLAVLAQLNVQFRFLVKCELERIPLLGLAMRRAGYIMIDRGDHTRALHSIELAAHKIRHGTSIFMFPEGTRSTDGHIGHPFKKGGFLLAIGAKVPIVPITINGARGVMPKGSRTVTPGTIRLTIGQPVQPDGLSCEALMEAVYKTIQFSYKGPRNFGSTKAAVQDGALLPHCQPTLGYGLQPKF